MCGICGIFNTLLRPVENREAIGPMSASLAHRGPDSAGLFETPCLALAIRRLSIIDLETGDQPLTNETGSVTLVYNGEIYNYRELRRRLLARGHQFKTRSDGEVIAHLYEEQQEKFAAELNGMFAIALWDEERKRLVLARDRAGEKPLYYWRNAETLVFGSEIKSILKYPAVTRKIDPEAVRQYMFYGYVPSPRSIFSGIFKLPAGSRMIFENGKTHLEPYWSLKDHLRPPGEARLSQSKRADLVEELRGRLREAAVSRLVSDVPLGVFLSGGVDSSTLVALMSELSQGRVSTFSVAFNEKSFNEEPYSTLVARRFRTDHHILRADASSLIHGLHAMAAAMDEPLADPALIPTWLLSRFARERVKVALSGEGSDELFGGYPTYLGEKLLPYYLRLPPFIRGLARERLAPLLPVSSGAVPLGLFLRRFMDYAGEEAAWRHQVWFGVSSPLQLNELFAETGGDLLDVISSPFRQAIEGARFENALAEALYLDFSLYLQDNLLVKIDRASMACSLELRTPFLDHRLIEFAARTPADLKVRRFELKSLLKEAVGPWLPVEIVRRQKRGFSVPIAGLLRGNLRPLAEEMLSPARLKAAGIFNPAAVVRVLEEHMSGALDHRKPLWALLCFELWREKWFAAS
ncbi:MAG: asparagine synthase (glutamine-hydrolyzing) [Acidobacteriota bacterium]|nr:asparagine synthase (glutamine-hydrolyzing) [Acidobacteriota bacterium]